MPVRGSRLELSDEELDARADLSPQRDLPGAREWAERSFPDPWAGLAMADEDSNDPATPDDETQVDGNAQ